MSTSLLLQIVAILLVAKLGGELFQRFLKQPAVLGELMFGIVLGKSVLGLVTPSEPVLIALAEIGAVLLLFEVGLESDMRKLFSVGLQALTVAVLGVILPFGMGYVVAERLGMPTMEAMFVGAALTATSVGITARVFSDLKIMQRSECQIVLGAAVIDDVLGLAILAVVSGLATEGKINVGAVEIQALSAIGLLVGAILIGGKVTPKILFLAGKMKTRSAVSRVAMAFCFLLAGLASAVKLAPIVGAFAAGLVLGQAEHKIHFEEKIRSVADIFIPIFFVMMGVSVDVRTFNLATPTGRWTVAIGVILLTVAVIGKLIAGVLVPQRGLNRLLVGIGMIPRGEVGLIFASVGLRAHLVSPRIYSSILFVIILSTLITPLLLKLAGRGQGPQGAHLGELVLEPIAMAS